MTAHERRIARYMQAHPGASHNEARGHKATPEHPEEARPDKHQSYYQRRKALVNRANAKKEELFGPSDGWRKDRSDKNTAKNPITGHGPSLKMLEQFLSDDFDIAEIDWTDDDWAFLYYH